MKRKKGFSIIDICGEKVLVAEGKENIDFSNIIGINESAAYLWEKVGGNDFDAETLAHLLTEEYDVPYATALDDATALVKSWLEIGILE